jgi:hypothetical protein
MLCAALAEAAVAGPPASAPAHPSLEGVWAANFILNLEATPKTPELVVSEARAKALAVAGATELTEESNKGLDPEVPSVIGTARMPIVRGQWRSRLVVVPADGRIPYTPEARKELEGKPPPESFANPEDRPASERCLVGLGQPPFTTFEFLNRLQIVQTRDHVVLRTEYSGDLRIIPFTDAHRPAMFASQLGDSIARWDGDTLVIETTGLPVESRHRIFPFLLVPSDSKVIERLTRVSKTELLYQFTVIDPKTFTAPWLAEFSWFKSDQQIYESACHEGDRSLRGILAGARRQEALAKVATP